MDTVLENFDQVLRAFGYTVLIFLFSAVLSLLLGLLLVSMRVGPVAVLRRAAATYVTVVRNTPLLLVFMFFAVAGPKIGLRFNWLDVTVAGFDLNSFFASAVVSLGLYSAAFVCEALRSGVNAVPLGQAEAARAIGLPFGGVLREVVLPQAVRAAVPPLASTLIAQLKNTSVAAVFGVAEAVSRMRSFTNEYTTDRWWIFIAFALGYVILVELLSAVSMLLERRWRIA
ncbi:amino acid ABC transporter permease [Nocardioides rotundus]|uniref:amino acid ABC transporter permease n=1 Tax=Nocardioides rotundus TaxID=1774216 RepID=UPI001CBC5F1A|nr:amino acid ABC transporter permease [Nocardioides rotundus]UAL30799.1 amino acid ABC transporter permease [Nocardioides rotundus]